MKRTFSLFLIVLLHASVYAQEYRVSSPSRDSVAVVDADGHKNVSLTSRPYSPIAATSRTEATIKRESYHSIEEMIHVQKERETAVVQRIGSVPSRELSSYYPGSIPFEESVSPTGGRIYSIPIATAAGWKLTPSIALVYNSQSGNNIGGYGWGLSGLSEISVRNRNLYYDGTSVAGIYDSDDAVYSLDGMPLVQSEMGVADYTLSTARGRVLVRKYTTAAGKVRYFSVLYPDGSSAIFESTNNTTPRSIYPITQYTDIEGNTISFTYINYDGCYYVSNISYGSNAEISFTYSTRSDGPPYKYARSGGYFGYPKRLLKTITSKDGNETIFQYTLTHEVADGVSLLKEFHCTSGTSEVPPLLFEYGNAGGNSGGTPSFPLVDQCFFQTYFQQHPDTTILYKRGRLIPGNQDDAIVTLPSFNNFSLRERRWSILQFGYCERYDSAYSPDQEILCNFAGYMYSSQRTILAGDGFQLIQPVDINGDGTDELVKINDWSSSAGVTTYKITIYTFDTNCNYTSTAFTVTVNDGTSNALFNNPAQSYYHFGNFRGDGSIQLLITTVQSSKFALVDLCSHVKLSESTLFSNSSQEENLILVADFENDGMSDICHVTETGMDVYSLPSSTGTTFSLRTTYSGVSKSLLYTDPWHTLNGSHEIFSRIYILDVNGDGYLDIMSAPALNMDTGGSSISTDIWNISRFNGKQFATETTSVYLRDQDDTVVFLDVDKDGLPDMLHLHGSSLLYSPNVNGIFTSTSTYTQLSLDANAGLVPGDISLFGTMGDILVMSGPFVNIYEFSVDHMQRRGLQAFTDSFGNVHSNQYGRTGGYSSSYLVDTDRSYSTANGFSRLRPPLDVLENSYTISGTRLVSSVSYLYWDAVWNSRGLGFCGFGKTLVTDGVNLVYTTTRLNPEKFGIAEEINTSKNSTGTPYSSVVNTYDDNSTTYGKLNPRLTKSVSSNILTGIETTTTYTYGSYDLPKSILTRRRIGSGTAKTEQIARTYQNSVNSTKYALGIVTEESVIREGDGTSTLKWKERTVYTRDSFYRPMLKKHYVGKYGFERTPLQPFDSLNILSGGTAQPNAHVIDTSGLIPFDRHYDATNLVSEVQWQYDANGNVISEKTAPYGATEFTGNTYTYDNSGRYLSRKTDPLGCYIAYNNYNKFGKPQVVVNDRGLVSYYSYDDWGNMTEVTRPDGGSEHTAISWGGSGLYTVTSTATGSPETVTHYDAQGREIRIGEKRFDGQWRWVDRTYDNRGRLYKVSLPYRGTSAAYWNTYAYDQYNRPISLTEASGKVSSWSYAGTSVTTVKEGITSTSTSDANGNVVSVIDAGGTITYTLRDDGKPSKITAPGDVETTFTFDDYGRRTKMVDPSADTQTDAYEWYSDGSCKLTHTNSHGTVNTYQDKYGRTTMIERPGEYSTTYTYDSYGRVTAEQSTNGTGKEYTYDSYNRIATAKETVPEGKWLQKVYGYSSGSILATIQYINHSGPITTETYSYSNGHNTGITLPDGTAVWTLTSENDLGLPTAITSGTVSREYGYTAFGMPTYRRMSSGSLQDFTYNFDVATGNLLSRSDVLSGQTETFGYDSLNRLVSMGSRQITYAANGNILSIDGVGDLMYDGPISPYRLGALTPEGETMSLVEPRQNVIYNNAEHPESISQNGITASLTYNGSDDRVKMTITHVATVGGTLVAEYSYDPWGRLRDPETLAIYSADNTPDLILGRGFTGHEHLPWFGLVNMNARLYDPLVGRFLSHDPYVQTPDFTQNFNRYSYCLNNPLKYSDENGEYIHIVIGAILGGAGNLIANWDNCDGFWEYFTSVTVGAAAGAAIAATGGAATGATGDIIRQTGKDFDGADNLNWKSVGISAAAGGVSGAVSAGVGVAMYGVHIPVTINGTAVESPILSSAIAGAATGAAGHIAGGTIAGVFWGDSFDSAFWNSLDGIGSSVLLGAAFSAASTTAYCMAEGVNPLNGKQLSAPPSANSLGLESEVQRIKDGINYQQYRHDGTTYSNREGLLPSGVTYKEFVVPPVSGNGPGVNRIVVGSDNNWYYTPDHYKTFIKFKP